LLTHADYCDNAAECFLKMEGILNGKSAWYYNERF
jgi:hypothetical protein